MDKKGLDVILCLLREAILEPAVKVVLECFRCILAVHQEILAQWACRKVLIILFEPGNELPNKLVSKIVVIYILIENVGYHLVCA